jgi:hypothetical protein
VSAPKNLLEAVLAVQGEAPTLPKNTENTFFRSKYTPLDTIVEIVGPLLNKNGLVWMAFPARDEHGDPALHYTLEHAPSAEKREGTMPLLLSKQDAQGQGSAITYARRYALCAVLNLVADDDDDGARAAAGQGQHPIQQNSRPASEKQIEYVRKLFKQKKLTVAQIRPVLLHAGVPAEVAENVPEAVSGLTGAWASNIIDVLTKGPIPTGGSDVPAPADGDFVREPVEDDPSLPFDPSVPA